MMTLDEAIEHCEEVANGMTAQGKCPECANDHRQLAEWLKDYKRLKEQEPKTAHWIERIEHDDYNDYEEIWFECDQCHCDADNVYNYCPHCGAGMEVSE